MRAHNTIVSKSGVVGGRLRQERERLCLSQSLFAGKVGVSRMTQGNYETGKRSPDALYLWAAHESGVDVGYVVTGTRAAPPDFYRMATVFLLESVEKKTGFAEDVLSFVIQAIADAAAYEWTADGLSTPRDHSQLAHMGDFIPLADLDAMIAALYENARLLRDIFGVIHDTLAFDPSLHMEGGKRLGLVLMLFRAFRASGEVDRDLVAEAIRLAVS